MELSVREWTIIVGVLLILAVFLDGYRRVRNERSNRIRVSLSKQVFNHHTTTVDEAPTNSVNPELPNGGARIIAKQRSQNLYLRESVPVLIEPVQMAPLSVGSPVEEPLDRADDGYASDDYARQSQSTNRAGLIESNEINELHEINEIAEPASIAPIEPIEPIEKVALERSRKVGQRTTREPSAREVADDWAAQSKQRAVEQSYLDEMVEEERGLVQPQEVLVVNVLSKDKAGFNGPDLLQILLACDLRFGKMQIFHRYEKANGRGSVQFSLANLVEPGTFDLDAIDSFSTRGVSFFMTLPGPQHSLTAFNYMIETAQVLVRNLNAELRDDAHSVMTAQTIEHCRQRIRDFERKQLTLQL